MSYDLGYEFGYESDWEKVPVKDARQAKASNSAVYSMSPPSGVRPGSPEWIRFYTDLAGTLAPPPGGASGTGGTAGTGGPSGAGGTGTANPNPPPGTGDPAAAGGLSGMGGTPVAPGSLPSGAPEGTPSLSHTELATAHSGAEWEGVRTELRDHYGFTPAEIDAFENQYNGRSPADLRSGEPPILPAHPSDTTPMTGLTGDAARRPRIEAGNAIRRRVADDAVHELGGRVHRMFGEPPEISRDTADAMAAQMYRRNGFDPDANPPNIGDLSAARARPEGGGPSRIDREMATLRGPTYRPPVPGEPSTGLHRSDPTVAPLLSETESVYRARAAENLGAAFGGVPGRGAYYSGTTAAGRTHRTEDAQAFFTHRGIDHDAGALRGIARTTTPARTPGGPVPPHPMQAEVTTFVSAYRTSGNNSLTPMGNGIATRMAADPSRPLDTTGWTPAARQQHDSAMAMRRYDTEARREEARTSHLNAIELANHNAGLTEDAAKRNFGRDMTRMGAQHELSMAQQHDQQLNQLMQNMANHGMQSMAQDKQAMQNLTLEQLRSINQITSQLIQAGSPRPFDIVAQMLGGGGGGRR